MKVLFSNLPHYEKSSSGELLKWVCAGARVPFSQPARCKPDQWADGHVIPFPYLMACAASYCQAHTGADVTLRDSVALHESYTSFARALSSLRPDLIFVETPDETWDHDRRILARIADEWCPLADIAICSPSVSAVSRLTDVSGLPNVVAVLPGEYEKLAVRVVRGASGVLEPDELDAFALNLAPFPRYSGDAAWRYHQPHGSALPMPQGHVRSVRSGGRRYTDRYLARLVAEIRRKARVRSLYFDDEAADVGDTHLAMIKAVAGFNALPWARREGPTAALTDAKQGWPSSTSPPSVPKSKPPC